MALSLYDVGMRLTNNGCHSMVIFWTRSSKSRFTLGGGGTFSPLTTRRIRRMWSVSLSFGFSLGGRRGPGQARGHAILGRARAVRAPSGQP